MYSLYNGVVPECDCVAMYPKVSATYPLGRTSHEELVVRNVFAKYEEPL